MGTAYVPMREAARRLGVSVDTIRRRVAAGELPAQREIRPQGYRWLVAVPAVVDAPTEAVSALLTQPEAITTGGAFALPIPADYVPAPVPSAPALVDFVPALPDWQTVRTTSAPRPQPGWQPRTQGPMQDPAPRQWWRRLLWA